MNEPSIEEVIKSDIGICRYMKSQSVSRSVMSDSLQPHGL